MIKVFTANAEAHVNEIIRLAKADGDTSKTWGYRQRVEQVDGKDVKRAAIFHDTKGGDWADKGEFWCYHGEGHVRFIFHWVPNGPKEIGACEKLHGRLVENLSSYFRPKVDFEKIEVTFGDFLRKM